MISCKDNIEQTKQKSLHGMEYRTEKQSRNRAIWYWMGVVQELPHC
jgi:hypothetical protein